MPIKQFLRGSHKAFCLDENERGETDLIPFEIDTRDQGGHLLRSDRKFLSQLRQMQDANVIQPHSSCAKT